MKKSLEIIYFPPNNISSISKLNIETSTTIAKKNQEINLKQSWDGSVEKVAILKTPELPKKIINESNEKETALTSQIPSQILRRILVKPSQEEQQKPNPLKEDSITENKETFVKITDENSLEEIKGNKKKNGKNNFAKKIFEN